MEKINYSQETENTAEHNSSKPERSHQSHESQAKSSEVNQAKAEQAKQLHEATRKIQEQAKSTAENPYNHKDNDTHKAHAHKGTFHEYGTKQTIKRIQKHLRPADRQFSKVIHNPVVESVSEITGATLARPSGLMYGGIFSLVASSLLYLISKHYGYEYSFFIGILFFIGGFLVGLIVEILAKPFTRKA
jgi:hypothetical protein